MILKIFSSGPLEVNCYIIGKLRFNGVYVIDPGGCFVEVRNYINENNLTLLGVVNTHAHFDHVIGVNQLLQNYKTEFLLHKSDVQLLSFVSQQAQRFGLSCDQPRQPDLFIDHGDRLQIESISYEVIHTPGHSPGSICLYCRESQLLISGDTLFKTSIGRTDLPGGNHSQLLESIKNNIFSLPEETIVYPGHGPSTTIFKEKTFNPFF